jgi:DNA-binding response OmpR family regulator
LAVYPSLTKIGISVASILLVEDSPLIAKIVSMGLEQAGHVVRVVDDGRAVLLAARESHPDLILLDVVLPGADGFAVLKQLRAHPATASVRVFMLTGQSDGPSILHGLDSGADAYLSKPIDIPDLLARIARVVVRPRVHA